MIETICPDCGERYQPSTDHVCQKRPAKKSTAARKDVRSATREPTGGGSNPRRPGTVGRRDGKDLGGTAGTQAPPVDTLKKAEAAAAHLAPDLTKRGTPRKRAPKGAGFDRKAYQRIKAQERRAKEKAEKESKS